jgi:transcriptional regulator with XRE-family HTH domain
VKTHKAALLAFGRVVRECRLSQGVSQQKLADEADLDVSYIKLIEAGRKAVSLNALFSLAGALNVLPSDLLRQTESYINM